MQLHTKQDYHKTARFDLASASSIASTTAVRCVWIWRWNRISRYRLRLTKLCNDGVTHCINKAVLGSLACLEPKGLIFCLEAGNLVLG